MEVIGSSSGRNGRNGRRKQPSHLATGPAGKSADEWVLNKEAKDLGMANEEDS